MNLICNDACTCFDAWPLYSMIDISRCTRFIEKFLCRSRMEVHKPTMAVSRFLYVFFLDFDGGRLTVAQLLSKYSSVGVASHLGETPRRNFGASLDLSFKEPNCTWKCTLNSIHAEDLFPALQVLFADCGDLSGPGGQLQHDFFSQHSFQSPLKTWSAGALVFSFCLSL